MVTISNLSELKTFANNVNSGTYDGGMFFLSNDIDCGGETISIGTADYPFKGAFYGQNFTISNFKIGYIHDYDPTSNYNTDVGGLFRVISGATIYDLRIYNFSDSGSSVLCRLSNVGGLVGAAIGSGNEISNCIVDTFSSTNSSLVQSTSGIFASGSAEVSDCLVRNVSCENDFYAIGPGAWSNNSSYASSCGNVVYTGSATSKGLYFDFNSSLGHEYVACYVSNLGDDFKKLTSISATKSTTWYYSADYNAWPMLTSFMSWQTVNFTAVNGTVNPTSIYIPSDATNTYSSTTNTINVYDQTVAASANSGYGFLSWTCNSVTSYTAYFEKLYCYYEFENLIVDGETVEATCSAFESGTKSLKIEFGVITEYEVVFASDKTSIKYIIGDAEVVYEVPRKYNLESVGYWEGQMWDDDPDDSTYSITDLHNYHSEYHLSVGQTLTISAPTLKLKTYNVTFK